VTIVTFHKVELDSSQMLQSKMAVPTMELNLTITHNTGFYCNVTVLLYDTALKFLMALLS